MRKTNSINKIFHINRSELKSRIDPIYYNSDLTKFNSGTFPSVTLKSIAISFKSGIGAGKQDQGSEENGIIQIRPTNINEDGFLKFGRNIYLPREVNLDKLEVDNVLFNNTNSQELVGKTAILKNQRELFYSNHITKIRVDKTKIIPDYLWIILNIYQRNKIFYSICTNWNNQSGIGIELLKSLEIPLPHLDTQQRLVELFQKAYTKKQEKEAKAKQLLKSINNYILKELSITLPEKNNSLSNRIFTTNFSDVLGNRFDPKLHDNETKKLKDAINNSHLPKAQLKSLIIQSIAGDWGKDENDSELESYVKCLVIRATEFDNQANLKLDNSRVKFRLIKKEKLARINIQENDLLIEKSGGSPDQPVGRIAILTQDVLDKNQLCYSNFIHKIRVNENRINPEYLFYFLKLIHNMKLTDAMQSQTNGIRNLIMSTYFNQSIILPDLNKQKKMVTHIKSIHQQIKTLQTEANSILENAKKEVEKIIIG